MTMNLLGRIVETLEAELGANRLPDGMLLVENRYEEQDFRNIAHAILQSIREPTPAMIEAATSNWPVADSGIDIRDAYIAMIDAALEEEDQPSAFGVST